MRSKRGPTSRASSHTGSPELHGVSTNTWLPNRCRLSIFATRGRLSFGLRRPSFGCLFSSRSPRYQATQAGIVVCGFFGAGRPWSPSPPANISLEPSRPRVRGMPTSASHSAAITSGNGKEKRSAWGDTCRVPPGEWSVCPPSDQRPRRGAHPHIARRHCLGYQGR